MRTSTIARIGSTAGSDTFTTFNGAFMNSGPAPGSTNRSSPVTAQNSRAGPWACVLPVDQVWKILP